LTFGIGWRAATGAGAGFFSIGFTFLYFAVKRSTRPAESMIFCFPVKKGWQLEQISTVMLGFVDRVSITLPQGQVAVTE
jgi:hypothetical protein